MTVIDVIMWATLTGVIGFAAGRRNGENRVRDAFDVLVDEWRLRRTPSLEAARASELCGNRMSAAAEDWVTFRAGEPSE